MNFHHKLDLALQNLREDNDVIWAAIDKYIDDYNGDLAKVSHKIINDLDLEYRPKLQALRQKGRAQHRTPNSRGTNGGPTFFQYLDEVDTYINPGVWGAHHDLPHLLATAEGVTANITNCSHDLSMGNIDVMVDENTWIQLETIVHELRSYWTIIRDFLAHPQG